jgi:hypothetical protein
MPCMAIAEKNSRRVRSSMLGSRVGFDMTARGTLSFLNAATRFGKSLESPAGLFQERI